MITYETAHKFFEAGDAADFMVQQVEITAHDNGYDAFRAAGKPTFYSATRVLEYIRAEHPGLYAAYRAAREEFIEALVAANEENTAGRDMHGNSVTE